MLLHRNVSHIETFVVASGLPTVVNEILDRNEPGIIYVYWSGVDVLNHERGAYGLEWEAEMTSMDQWIAAFTQSARNRAWLWITADHGHIPIAGRLRYYDLRRTLSWLPEIPTQIGPAIAVDMELPANFSSIVNNWASVPIDMVRTKDWWDKGYFGPGADIQHMERIGSYLLIPPAGWQWQITDEPQHPWGHGGTTQPEMTVPWIEVSLEGRRYVC
jgi:hypothetical protein